MACTDHTVAANSCSCTLDCKDPTRAICLIASRRRPYHYCLTVCHVGDNSIQYQYRYHWPFPLHCVCTQVTGATKASTGKLTVVLYSSQALLLAAASTSLGMVGPAATLAQEGLAVTAADRLATLGRELRGLLWPAASEHGCVGEVSEVSKRDAVSSQELVALQVLLVDPGVPTVSQHTLSTSPHPRACR